MEYDENESLLRLENKDHCANCRDKVDTTSQCPGLKQHYSTSRTSHCGKHPTCRTGETSCKSYHCGGWFEKQRCCMPTNPKPNPSDNLKCCAGRLTGPDRFGVCNSLYCPHSDKCNDNMAVACKLNLPLWTEPKGCSNYVAVASNNSSNTRVYEGGRTVLRDTMNHWFGKPYSKDFWKDTNWPKKINLAKNNCQYYPDVCQDILKGDGKKKGFCSTVTRKDVVENEHLKTLCGCFMPKKQYPYRGFVTLDCSTECNGLRNIHPPDWKCNQTVCIIDNVTVNEVDSNGNVNLNQVCGGGKDSVCLLKDVNVNQINSSVGGGTNINQQCQLCYEWIGGDSIDDKSVYDETAPGGFKPDKAKWKKIPCTGRSGFIPRKYWIPIGIGIIVLIILFLIGVLVWAFY